MYRPGESPGASKLYTKGWYKLNPVVEHTLVKSRVLGQIYGDYNEGRSQLGLTSPLGPDFTFGKAEDLGFDINDVTHYDDLQAAWELEIAARQAR